MNKIISLFPIGILLLSLSACSNNSKQESGNINSENLSNKLQIRVEGGDGQNIVFQLNDSPAAHTLYEQLPLSIQAENYSHNEKIFYPPNELDTSDTPLAEGPAGTLAYYEPWGDVVLYYGECGGASGLYALGEAVSGTEQIETLSSEIRIEAVSSEKE